MGEPIFCGKFRTTVTGNAVSEGSFNWGVWVHARCRLQHLVPVLQDLTANKYQRLRWGRHIKKQRAMAAKFVCYSQQHQHICCLWQCFIATSTTLEGGLSQPPTRAALGQRCHSQAMLGEMDIPASRMAPCCSWGMTGAAGDPPSGSPLCYGGHPEWLRPCRYILAFYVYLAEMQLG